MGIIHLHCLWRSEQHVRKQIPEDYGVKSGWGMFRVRGEIPQLFSGNEEADQRYMFFTDGQTRDLER